MRSLLHTISRKPRGVVITHIGMHKTGSTSIQDAFQGYDDGRLRYARLIEPNHSIPIYTAFSCDASNYHIWQRIGFGKRDIEDKAKEYRNALQSELRKNRMELLISGEDIGLLNDEEKRKYIEFVAQHRVTHRVVMFARSPVSFVGSMIQQQIRGNSFTERRLRTDYRRRIHTFQEVLGKENMRVLDYDAAVRGGRSVVQTFASLVDANVDVTARSNPSHSLRALSVIYALNKAPLTVFGEAEMIRTRQRIVDLIVKAFSSDGGRERLDESMVVGLADPQIERDCDYLRDEFGIDYPFRREGDELPDVDAYFADVMGDPSNELVGMFDKVGAKYDRESSVPENFAALYLHLSARTVGD